MSSDSVSYYDWSLSFKKNDDNHNSLVKNTKLKSINSLGLSDDKFKDYLEEWKKKNFS